MPTTDEPTIRVGTVATILARADECLARAHRDIRRQDPGFMAVHDLTNALGQLRAQLPPWKEWIRSTDCPDGHGAMRMRRSGENSDDIGQVTSTYRCRDRACDQVVIVTTTNTREARPR